MKLNHPGLYWVRDSCMSTKVKLYTTDHHSALEMSQNAISVFYLKIVLLTPDLTLRCQIMNTQPNRHWNCVKMDIFVFLWKMFFWPRKGPYNPRGWVLTSTDLRFVKNSIFPCFYGKCSFDPENVPLTCHKQTNKQTDKQTHFNFFRITLPSVEGIFLLFICEYPFIYMK